jgi:putative flippase GtrA
MKINKTINEIIRFVIVGTIATLLHYGIYILLLHILSTNISYTLGYIGSLLVNFILTSYYTFKGRPNIMRALGFIGSHLINYTLHIILLNFFLWTGINKIFAPIPVYLIAIPINFFLVRFVFKSNKFKYEKNKYTNTLL